jgi:pimeloyl-ACP methyl ester carboxylesterase
LSTVALVAPLGHRAAAYFEPLRQALGEEVALIALEYPGADFDFAAPELLRRVVDGWTEGLAASGQRPDLLGGVSLGGTLAWGLAARLPPRRGLLLLAPGGLPVARARQAALQAALAERGAAAFAARALAAGPEARHLPGLPALLRAALAVDLRPTWATAAHAVTLVWGAEDRVFGARHRARMVAALPRHGLHLLAGVGHHACREAPAAVATIVRALLA